MTNTGEVTALLDAIRKGEPDAETRLWAVVYEQLHALAHRNIAGERKGHTWQTTDLVSEWCLRALAGDELQSITNRSHLFNTAALAMKHLLVDRARSRKREKHGGHLVRVVLVPFPVEGFRGVMRRPG